MPRSPWELRPKAALLAGLLAGLALQAPQNAQAQDADALVGHWRKTTIRFEQPRDEHLVLGADGRMANWVVTADSRSDPLTGAWSAEGAMLTLSVDGGNTATQPFTFYNGRLVFPNAPNRRGFWDKIEE